MHSKDRNEGACIVQIVLILRQVVEGVWNTSNVAYEGRLVLGSYRHGRSFIYLFTHKLEG